MGSLYIGGNFKNNDKYMGVEESIKYDEVVALIKRFNNDIPVVELKERYNKKSFFDTLSVDRKELQHTSFISWLLNPMENEDLYLFPIKKLIELLVLKSEKSKIECSENLKDEFYESIILEDYKIKIDDFKIIRESKIDDKNIPDIIVVCSIEFKLGDEKVIKTLNLLLENKLNSSEGNNQTKRYFESFKSFVKRNNKQDVEEQINIYGYLSIDKNKDLTSQQFINISYQDFLEKILEPSCEKVKSERIKFILNEYIKFLGQSNSKNRIMALGTKEKALLEKFWENNFEIIQLALEARSQNPELSKESIDKTRSFLESINNEKLEITLEPQSVEDFKRELMRTKKAEIKILYENGSEEIKIWNVKRFNEESNLMHNLRSRSELRNKNWQEYGIKKAEVKVVD